MFCNICGTQNKDGTRFCKSCGASLREAAELLETDAGRSVVEQQSESVKKDNGKLIIGIAVGIVAVIMIVAAVMAALFFTDDEDETEERERKTKKETVLATENDDTDKNNDTSEKDDMTESTSENSTAYTEPSGLNEIPINSYYEIDEYIIELLITDAKSEITDYINSDYTQYTKVNYVEYIDSCLVTNETDSVFVVICEMNCDNDYMGNVTLYMAVPYGDFTKTGNGYGYDAAGEVLGFTERSGEGWRFQSHGYDSVDNLFEELNSWGRIYAPPYGVIGNRLRGSGSE